MEDVEIVFTFGPNILFRLYSRIMTSGLELAMLFIEIK